MTQPRKRGRGRPPISEEGPGRARYVRLPPELDDAAARAKGRLGWSEWLRELVEERVRREPLDTPPGDG